MRDSALGEYKKLLFAARNAMHNTGDPAEARAAVNRIYRQMMNSKGQDSREKRVLVVNGSPGSGKTHYVRERIGKSDIVLDFDYITAALAMDDKLYGEREPQLDVALAARETIINEIAARRGSWETAYIITAEKNQQKVQALVDRLIAELVTINTTPEQCKENIRNDKRRSGFIDRYISLVDSWFK